MAEITLTDCKLYIDEFDLSGKMNALALNAAAETVDNTAFGDSYRSRLGGLITHDFAHEGFTDLGANLNDAVIFSKLNTEVVVVAGVTGAENTTGFFNKAILRDYTHGGAIGEQHSFSIGGESTNNFVRGHFLRNATSGSTVNGTALNLGAVLAAEKLYAALVVYAASGTSPTLDIKIQSDSASGFSSPADRITFTQATAIGSQYATPVSGAITDDHWRVNVTIGGTDPSFTYAVIMGIQ